MNNIALFNDYFKVVRPTDEQIELIKDSLVTTPSGKRGLEVTLEATHSALFNQNLKFYLPSRMRDGTNSFIHRKKPAKILKHHNAHADPVGIITGAEYVDTIPEILKDNKDVQILLDSSNSLPKQVQAAKRLLRSSLPFSEGWRGLGYIKLKALILDESTIAQLQDGLFDAVSTSFSSPGEVYCSICGQNWAKEGYCEHELGERYADEEADISDVCCAIPGIHKYNECSLVVFDADPLTTIEIGDSVSSKKWDISVEDWKKYNDASESSESFRYEFKDFKEEKTMDGNSQSLDLNEDQQAVLQTIKKLFPEMEDSKATEYAKKLTETKQDGLYPNQVEAEIDEETAIQYAIDSFETEGQEINADEIYSEMEKELDELNLADAKLSSESRNKLSASTFCGPNRSFPVPDCAHVTAAKRLIGRYKGPGDKASILACVSKKAKALGCGESKSESSDNQNIPEVTFTMPTCETIKLASNSDAQSLFALTEAELISRGLKIQRECSKCAAHEDETKKVSEELKNSQDKVKDLEVTLKVLREELKRQYSDYAEQVDNYVQQGLQLRAAKEEKVALISVLCGKYNDMKDATEAMRSVDLQATETSFNFNLEDAVKKLNDGMARKPEGTITDPTINPDNDNIQMTNGLSAAAQAAISNIKDFMVTGELVSAKKLYDKMVYCKVLDEQVVPFDSLQQLNNKSAE